MEIIPIVDPTSKEIVVKGFAERDWAENQGLTHLTTIIVPVRADRRIQVQIRNRDKRTYSGCRDLFGGHVSFGVEFFSSMFGVELNIASVVLGAAVREANEELRLHSLPQRLPLEIGGCHLIQVGRLGEFSCDLPHNQERSTVYLFPIPRNTELSPMDDEKGEFAPVESAFHTFSELCQEYQAHPQDAIAARTANYESNKRDWQIADGAGRILSDVTRAQRLADAIGQLSDEAFLDFPTSK